MYSVNNNIDNNERYMFFGAIDKSVRDMFFNDLDKAVTLISIIFNTNFQDNYKELENLQSYFSYSIYEKVLNIKRTKLQRILKELRDEGYIEWVVKSQSKHKTSIIGLNYQYGKGYGREYSKQYGKMIDITKKTGDFNTVRNTVSNTVEDTLSKNISKNISKEDKEEGTNVISINTNTINKYKYYIDLNITPFIRDEIIRLETKYGEAFVVKAIEESANRNGKCLKYIIKLLEDWDRKGFKKVEDIETSIEKWNLNNEKRRKNREKNNSEQKDKRNYNKETNKFNNFDAREYDYDELEKKLLGWDE